MTLLHNRFTDEHKKDKVLMSEVTSASGKGEAAHRQQETGEDVESLDSSFTSLLMNDGAK